MNTDSNFKELIEMISALARLDFKHKIVVKNTDTSLAVISSGLNMLSEELEATVVSKNKYKQSRKRFEALAKNVPEYFTYLDAKCNFQFVNQLYLNDRKLKAEEIIGKNLQELTGKYYRNFRPHIKKVLSGEKTEFETEVEIKGQGLRIIHAKYVPDFNEKGKVIGFYSLVRDITEIRQKEEQSSLYFDIIHQSSNEIYMFDAKTMKFTYVNQGGRKNSGYTKKELLKMTPLDLKKSVSVRNFKRMLSPIKKGEKNFESFETRYFRKDGSSYPVEVKVSFVASSSGSMFVAIVNDITDKNNTETQLKQILNSYQKLFNATVVGIFIIDHKTKQIIRVNKSGAKNLKYSPKELIGTSFKDHFHRSDQDLVIKIMSQPKRKSDVAFEARQIDRYNIPFYVEVSVKEVKIEGETVCLIFVKDITEKKRGEERLKQSEKNYRELYNQNIAGLYRADMDYRIIECNIAFVDILGQPDKESVIGKNIKSLFKDSSDRSAEARERKLGELNCFETKITLPNGEEKWILENVKLIFDENRLPKYIEGTIFEITERIKILKNLESEKRERARIQSQLLSSQLNPHFIFNTLNSFQYYVLNKDIEDSLNYISNFSFLMREVLENSMHEFITFSDEIKFLDNYLKISQSRKTGNFSYKIDVAKNFCPDEVLIPPMLLQPYIENSIIHGFGAKSEEGELTIEIYQKNGSIYCAIIDNGIGRKAGKKASIVQKGITKRSLGMNILANRIQLLNDLYDRDFNVRVSDLFNENGSPKGTKVVVSYLIIREEE